MNQPPYDSMIITIAKLLGRNAETAQKNRDNPQAPNSKKYEK